MHVRLCVCVSVCVCPRLLRNLALITNQTSATAFQFPYITLVVNIVALVTKRMVSYCQNRAYLLFITR